MDAPINMDNEKKIMIIVESKMADLQLDSKINAVHHNQFVGSIKNCLIRGFCDTDAILQNAEHISGDDIYMLIKVATKQCVVPINVSGAQWPLRFLANLQERLTDFETKAREIATAMVDIDEDMPRSNGRNSFLVIMQEFCDTALLPDVKLCITTCLKQMIKLMERDNDAMAFVMIKEFFRYTVIHRSSLIAEFNDKEICAQMKRLLNSKKYDIHYPADMFDKMEDVEPLADMEINGAVTWDLKWKRTIIFRYDNIWTSLLHNLFRHDLVIIFASQIPNLSRHCLNLRRKIVGYGEPEFSKFECYWRSRSSEPDRKLLVEYQTRLAEWIMKEMQRRKFVRRKWVGTFKWAYIFKSSTKYLVVILRSIIDSYKMNFVTAYYVEDLKNFS